MREIIVAVNARTNEMSASYTVSGISSFVGMNVQHLRRRFSGKDFLVIGEFIVRRVKING